MLSASHRRWFVPLVVSTLALLFDQASKVWIVQLLGPEPLTRSIPLAGEWLRLIYSHNTGVAFGLFQGMSQLFIFTSIAISLGAIYVYWQHLPNRDPLLQVSIGLIIGGAFGNVIDRLRLGYVVDFIQVGWWPVFNIADSAICVGAALMVLQIARFDAVSRQEQAPAQ